MNNALGGILVVCDMDGTLLRSDNTIAPADMDTIRLFRMLGGHFTVATGRTTGSVAMYPQLAELIDPAITGGGGVIYDFAQSKVAKSYVLPHLTARNALRDILHAFPKVGAMAMCDNMRLYQIAWSQELRGLIDTERMTWFSRPTEDLQYPWNKLLFAGPKDTLRDMANFVETHTYPGVYFVSTNQYYYEMMPKGVSKGSALHDLCAILDIPVKNTVVIGDYYNDLDIMRQAGHSVAMSNAPDEVRGVAHEVTGSNDEGGVGQYLYKLIRKYAP